MRIVLNQIPGRFAAAARRLAYLPALLLCAWLLTLSASAKDYNYCFEVTTSIATGKESQIQFFIITYSSSASSAELHSKFIFPYDGDLSNDMSADADNPLPFQSYARDQYMFTTQTEIKSVQRIQMFVSATPLKPIQVNDTEVNKAAGGSWNCAGMRLFRVDRKNGDKKQLCNPLSIDYYMDFEGELLAEFGKDSVNWATDKLISFTVADGFVQKKSGDRALANKFNDKAAGYTKRQLQSPSDGTLAIKFDFADTAFSGLESLCTSPDKLPRSVDNLPECMALTMFYVDRYGAVRRTSVGIGTSAAQWAVKLGLSKDKPIMGMAQQGESVAAAVFLPDFAEFRSSDRFTVTLGAEKIGKLLHTEGSSVADEANGANITGVQVYNLKKARDDGIARPASASIDSTTQSVVWKFDDNLKPSWYHIANSTAGEPLRANEETAVSIEPYKAGDRLKPRDTVKDRLLVEICTDTVPGAGTKQDIMMQVSYNDLYGIPKSVQNINVRERVMDFYGYWPGSPKDDKFAYYLGCSEGQTIRFFVDIKSLKEITDVRLWINKEGGVQDDWQLKEFALFSVKSYDRRGVEWTNLDLNGMSTDRRVNRFVDATLLYTLNGIVERPSNPGTSGGGGSASGGNASGGGNASASGSSGGGLPVLIQPGESSQAVGPSNDIIGADPAPANVDWSQIRYSMTFQQACGNLGFNRTKINYDVAVTVAKLDDTDTSAANEDCGSDNLFYFRLIFTNGSSSYVLANQQLAADSFRTGMVEHFYISTNQDYGEVTAVQIIPEDISADSDKFDKLKIDMIEVSKIGAGAIIPTWTIHDVGWIGIDYRDDSQMTGIVGQQGRSAEEVIRSYAIDGSCYKSNLMVTITTGENQFEGTLSGEIWYQQSNGEIKKESIGDVVRAMYSFMNRQADVSETKGGFLISDPTFMFRPNHTDRFLVPVENATSVTHLELTMETTNEKNGSWFVDDVSVYLCNGTGRLLLNTLGEYTYQFKAGQEPKYLASGDSTNTPHKYKQDFQEAKGNAIVRGAFQVNFTENEIEINPASRQWSARVSRTPDSQNDALNLYLYPGKVSAGGGSPTVAVQYTTMRETIEQQAPPVQRDLEVTLSNGQPLYYASNISVTGMKTLNKVLIGKGSTNGITDVTRAVVQRVRDGVVIESRDMAGTGSTDFAAIELADRNPAVREQQRLQFQFGADTEATPLVAEENDIAVCMWFRSNVPSSRELRTPYVYLTDQGVTSIGPGQIVNLTFDMLNVWEITGFSFISTGDVKASVSAACANAGQIERATGKQVAVGKEYGFDEPFALAAMPHRMSPNPDTFVQKVTLRFVTEEATEAVNSGVNGPVRVTLGYFNQNYDMRLLEIADIRTYLTDGADGFPSGSTKEAVILMPKIRELRWVELEPRSQYAGEETKANWRLKSFAASLGEGGAGEERRIGRTIYEGDPLRVNLSNILVTATVETVQPLTAEPATTDSGETTTTSAESKKTMTLTGGGSEHALLESGQGLRITTTLEGTTDGFDVTLESLHYESGATGAVNLEDTRGYSRQYLDQRAATAPSEEEAKVWQSATPAPGSFEPKTARNLLSGTVISFTPPRNYTGNTLSYRIRIVPKEAPTADIIVDVTVTAEVDPVQRQLEEAIAAAEARRKAQEEALKALDNFTMTVYTANALQAPYEQLFSAHVGEVSLTQYPGDRVEFTVTQGSGAMRYNAYFEAEGEPCYLKIELEDWRGEVSTLYEGPTSDFGPRQYDAALEQVRRQEEIRRQEEAKAEEEARIQNRMVKVSCSSLGGGFEELFTALFKDVHVFNSGDDWLFIVTENGEMQPHRAPIGTSYKIRVEIDGDVACETETPNFNPQDYGFYSSAEVLRKMEEEEARRKEEEARRKEEARKNPLMTVYVAYGSSYEKEFSARIRDVTVSRLEDRETVMFTVVSENGRIRRNYYANFSDYTSSDWLVPGYLWIEMDYGDGNASTLYEGLARGFYPSNYAVFREEEARRQAEEEARRQAEEEEARRQAEEEEARRQAEEEARRQAEEEEARRAQGYTLEVYEIDTFSAHAYLIESDYLRSPEYKLFSAYVRDVKIQRLHNALEFIVSENGGTQSYKVVYRDLKTYAYIMVRTLNAEGAATTLYMGEASEFNPLNYSYLHVVDWDNYTLEVYQLPKPQSSFDTATYKPDESEYGQDAKLFSAHIRDVTVKDGNFELEFTVSENGETREYEVKYTYATSSSPTLVYFLLLRVRDEDGNVSTIYNGQSTNFSPSSYPYLHKG